MMSIKQEIEKEFDEACRRFLKEAWTLQMRYCDAVCRKREGCPAVEALRKDVDNALEQQMPHIQWSVLLIVDHLVHECTGVWIGRNAFLSQLIARSLIL